MCLILSKIQTRFEIVTNDMLKNHSINGSTTVLIYTSLLNNAVLLSNLNDTDSKKEWLQVVNLRNLLTIVRKGLKMKPYANLTKELISIFTQYHKNKAANEIPIEPVLGTLDYYELLIQAQEVYLILCVSIIRFCCVGIIRL